MYALVVAKGGPKLTESKVEADPKNAGKGAPHKMMMGPGRVSGEGSTVEFLASSLSHQVGRTIVDKTGLSGHYDFNLTWTPDQGGGGGDRPGGMMAGPGGPGGMPPGGGASDPGSGASLFTAIQEQLGLKLEPQKSMVDVVVVDHLEKPSEN